MRIDSTTNFPHGFSPNHHIAEHMRTQRIFSRSRYDIVEISDAARARYRATARQHDSADLRNIAKSYEPLVRKALRQLEYLGNERKERISQLKNYYDADCSHHEEEIIREMVEALLAD